ncbi:MAG: spore cortex biosynthesis protein YabQ [Clostridia bacterium]
MNLFFETSNQARVFLAAVPIGFVVSLLIDCVACARHMRPVLDVLCLLACGLMLIAVMLLFGDDGLRVYHLLALAVGACIYLCGVGRLVRMARKRWCLWKAKNKLRSQAGTREEMAK